MRRIWLAFAALSQSLLADVLVLKNGDRLSGAIVTTTAKGVSLKSDLAGDVVIPFENVTEFSSKEAIAITTSDGKRLTGVVRTEGSAVVVGETRVDRGMVTAARALDAQKVFEVEQERAVHPGFLDLYTGFVDFGLANTSGNAETRSVNTVATLARITTKDKISLRFAQIFASNTTAGTSLATAQAVRGGIGYQRNIGARWFLNAFNDYDYDRFLLLDLRTVFGGGLGYNAIKNERTLLTFGGGGAYNREKFAADETRAAFTRESGEVYFNQEFTYKLNSRLTVSERFTIFPNLSNPGDYRINFDGGLVASIYRSLAMQFIFSNRYLTNPPAGRKTNDTLLTTGIRYTIPSRVKQ